MTSATGPMIDGLEFLEHLGAGGYSDVYLYERRSPRMKVAVKVLREGRLSPYELAQFEAEAETMAELADHPNIVQVFHADKTVDGRPYLVMKYYPNANLGERANAERFPVSEVLRTGIKIASAIETAHRAQIVHRDIKPANILVDRHGEPGLTDFGIAGRAADLENGDDLGVSIPWSPPEVLTGQSNGSVRADVYSLGATLWHLLVGRSPFQTTDIRNDQHKLVNRVLHTTSPSTGRADVPDALERLLAQTMAKSPAARPASALEVAQALQGIEQQQRLPRTAIVVEGASTTLTRPSVGHDVEDGTRIKGPTRVVAQASSPPAPSVPRRADHTAEPPTRGRPTVRTAQDGRDRRRPTAADAGSTVHRARDLDQETTGAVAPHRGVKRRTLLLAAGAIVMIAAVVGVAVASGGGDDGDRDRPLPTQLANDQTSAPVTVATPILKGSYDSRTGTAVFTWSPVGAAGGSVLWIRAGQSPTGAKRTSERTIRIKTKNPASTCIQITYVTADTSQQSQTTDPVCAAS